MKPILNIQIDPKKIGSSNIINILNATNRIREIFTDKYDVIITPEFMDIESTNNIVNLTISSDTDIPKLMQELERLSDPKEFQQELKESNGYQAPPLHYDESCDVSSGKIMSLDIANRNGRIYPNNHEHYEDFHHKYMKIDAFLARSFDGDPDRSPVDMLDEYWYPIIQMVNHTDMSPVEILPIFKNYDVNPYSVTSIYPGPLAILIRIRKLDWKILNGQPMGDYREDEYFHWMISKINYTKYPINLIMDTVKNRKNISPWLITCIEYNPSIIYSSDPSERFENCQIDVITPKIYNRICPDGKYDHQIVAANIRRRNMLNLLTERPGLKDVTPREIQLKRMAKFEFPLNTPVRNKIYSTESMEKAIHDNRIQELLKTGCFLGCYPPVHPNHYACDSNFASINPSNAAVSIKELKIVSEDPSGDKLEASVEFLDTEPGKIAAKYFDEGLLTIAPRLIGKHSFISKEEVSRIDDFKLITFDFMLKECEELSDDTSNDKSSLDGR